MFREYSLCDGTPSGPAVRLTAAVKAVEGRHEVKLPHVER